MIVMRHWTVPDRFSSTSASFWTKSMFILYIFCNTDNICWLLCSLSYIPAHRLSYKVNKHLHFVLSMLKKINQCVAKWCLCSWLVHTVLINVQEPHQCLSVSLLCVLTDSLIHAAFSLLHLNLFTSFSPPPPFPSPPSHPPPARLPTPESD